MDALFASYGSGAEVQFRRTDEYATPLVPVDVRFMNMGSTTEAFFLASAEYPTGTIVVVPPPPGLITVNSNPIPLGLHGFTADVIEGYGVPAKTGNLSFKGLQATVRILLNRTVKVDIHALDQQGNPMSGAYITAILDKVDIDPDHGFVAPEQIEVRADGFGEATLHLWPNALGENGSKYVVTIENPDTGSVVAISALIPDNDCILHEVGTLMA